MMIRSLAARRAPLTLAALVATGLLAGCGSDDDDASGDAGTPPFAGIGDDDAFYAFASGATPTFDAGQIERLTVGDTIESSGTTPATGSDIRVATDGTDVYQIGRFRLDTLTRFRADELTNPVYQYSVNGDETASNPYDIAFLNDERAYIARYGSPLVWVVNPSAETRPEFKLGELDLSGYDADGVPEAANVAIVDDKLFVLMQRLTDFAPVQTGYVAVFDTATDQEIDTGMGLDGLLGIPLPVTNPEGLQYVESTDELLVTGRGNLFGSGDVEGDPYQGGIVSIDPTTYTADLYVDDGTSEDNDGFIAESLVVSDDAGYVLTYEVVDPESFDSETALRRFDPRTGLIEDGAVAGLEGRDLGPLAAGPDGNLWVGETSDAPGFILIDPATDAIVDERVATEFNPTGIVFVPVPSDADDAALAGPR